VTDSASNHTDSKPVKKGMPNDPRKEGELQKQNLPLNSMAYRKKNFSNLVVPRSKFTSRNSLALEHWHLQKRKK